jgi:hypothetical protein
MSRYYELIAAIHPYAQNGQPIWEFFAGELASPEVLATLTRDGYANAANQLARLHAAGDYRATVKFWDAFFCQEMVKLAVQGNQWAAAFLDLCHDKEVLFELLLKHGIERMRELIILERRTENAILASMPFAGGNHD